VLRSVPGISAAYLGWPDGSFVLLRPIGPHRERLAAPPGAAWLAQWASPEGARFEFLDEGLGLTERRDDVDYPFDPRLRPWFREANLTAETVVTAPYLFFTTLEPGITAARRASSGAVAGVDVALWELSERLSAGRLTAGAEAVVLDATGGVMADASSERLRRLVAGRTPTPASPASEILPRADELGTPVLAALSERWRAERVPFDGRLRAAGEDWLATIVPLSLPGTTFVMAAPERALDLGPRAIRARLLQIAGLALLLAVPVVWLAARLIARPVATFARETQAVARLQFEHVPRLDTRVRELAELDDAIAAMRTALGGFTAVAQGIVAAEESPALLAGTLDAVLAAAEGDRGAAWLLTEGELRLAAVRGAPGADVPDAPEGTDLAGRIAAATSPLVETIAQGDPVLGPLAGGSGPVAVLGIPLRTRNGDVVGAIAVARKASADVAFPPPILALADAIARPVALAIDRRRLIAAQRASLDQLRLLETAIARLNDVVIITEADPLDAPDGPRIVFVNEAFVRLTGWSPGEAIGRTPRMLQGPDTSREELDRIGAALRRGEPVRAEVVNYTKAGAPLRFELDIAPIATAAGRITHFVAVERETTERHRLEERLRQSQRLEALGQLTGGVVHDFNNLLTVILGNAETLADDLAHDDRLRRLAEMTANAAERGAELTDRLLAFARRRPLE
ncbi:PAS domain S-box protein, partial [Elioraea sp.]|uniref:PAS domain S-box protein n=1 Tax=Elioraea sp. TaxID=2185103 RepID=UPI003F7173CB